MRNVKLFVLLCEGWYSIIHLTKTTAAQNDDALSYMRVRGLYYLAVVFVRSISDSNCIHCIVYTRGVQHAAHLTSLCGPFYYCQVLLHFLKGKKFFRKEKFFEGGKFSWDGKKFFGIDRLLTSIWKKNEVPKKKDIKKFKGSEVKYIEFAMSNFAALLTMVRKILAQWCSCVGHPWCILWIILC